VLQIYNTLTRKKEPFVTRDPGRVGMYVCGINPYDYSHIGHARSYIAFDVIRRWLEFSGYEVTHIQNFTDIEDNILQRAAESGRDWREMVGEFTQAYFEDFDALGVLRAHRYPHATEHIPEMLGLVNNLVEKGVAYPVEGDVYLEVSKVPGYGRLSGRRLDELQAGARVEVDERKRSPLDFALWKAAKPGEPSWDSPWGPGRPGWHIECSAMSAKYLGEGFDIHGGGQDLIFPHHENEIAQSEGATGHPFVRYWVHNGWVTVNREKMSKSLGNFFTIREVLAKFRPEVVRLFLLMTHYRSAIEFSDAALEQARGALERLEIAVQHMDRLLSLPTGSEPPGGALAGLADAAGQCEAAFREAMDDDFNTPRAISALFDLVAELNRLTTVAGSTPTAEDRPILENVRGLLLRLAAALGINLEAGRRGPYSEEMAQRIGGVARELGVELPESPVSAAEAAISAAVDALVRARDAARSEKQYQRSDAIRSRLRDLGVILEDHPEGTTWRWA